MLLKSKVASVHINGLELTWTNIVFLFINDYKEKYYATCIARCYLTHYRKVTNIKNVIL